MEWGDEEKQAPKKRAFRRKQDGQLGFMVERHGREWIRLDRPGEEILFPYNENLWEGEDYERPFSRIQVSRIAFDADRSLCRALGELAVARKQWESLSDQERIDWTNNGPPAGPRAQLYQAILANFPGAR